MVLPSRIIAKHPRKTDWHTYKERHLVEKLFLKLKNNRRFATRYEKKALFSTPLSASPVSSFGYFDGFKTDAKACLKIVNTPKRRLFFRHTLPIFLGIHKVFLRQTGFVRRPPSWAYFPFSNSAYIKSGSSLNRYCKRSLCILVTIS